MIKKIMWYGIVVLLVWAALPFEIPIRFQVQKSKIDLSIKPLSIRFSLGGVQINKEFQTKLGLDLQGGSHLVFIARTGGVRPEDRADALISARDIIERRVNLYGVSEPVVQTVKVNGQDRISVDLPGIENVEEAVSLIGRTAQLQFMEEDQGQKYATDTPIFSRLTRNTGLSGKHVKKAGVTFNNENGSPQVSLEFNSEGAKLFEKITERNIGKPLGIFLDAYPIMYPPTVSQRIPDGQAVITGSFSIDEAKQLAIAINSGALPIPIELVEQRNIGPTLGALEVRRSVVAGLIGLTMVALFMIGYYGRLGIIAVLGLTLYGLITFVIFRAVPVVLTLPGIAGFILSIGMAVDSNILIFERIKEEQRKGRDFATASRLGFGRAIDAIKDANITTLIVAFILFNPLNWGFLPQFGLVRGFALTLAIGVATSLFTGIVITRRLIGHFYKST